MIILEYLCYLLVIFLLIFIIFMDPKLNPLILNIHGVGYESILDFF